MSNYRHGFSFVISSIIFTLIGFSFFLLAQKVEKPKRTRLSPIIKIAIISSPIKRVVEKKNIPHAIVPPIPIHHKVHKRIKHKRIKHKRIKHKRIIKRKIHKKKRVIKKKRIKKKIIKKRVAKKRVIKKRVIKPKKIKYKEVEQKRIKEPIIKDVYIPPKEVEYKYKEQEEPIIQEVYYTPPIPQPKRVVTRPVIKAPAPIQKEVPIEPQRVDKSAEKQQFLSQVRSQIISNKKYPKIALRRHIQGTVKVRFDITASGNVSNIRYISGKRILQKGARRAIEKSFPIDIPNYLRNEFPINDISVSIHFNID